MGTAKQTKQQAAATVSKQSSQPESDKLVQEYFEKLKEKPVQKPAVMRNLPVIHKAERTLDTISSLIGRKDRIAMLEITRELSLEKLAERKDLIQISLYRRETPAALNDLLLDMLCDFADSFTITNNLSADHIEEIAAEIQVNYWHLSLEHIMLFLRQVKKGEYGIVYNLDVNKMLTWLCTFDQKHTAQVLQRRNNEAAGYEPIKPQQRQTGSLKLHLGNLQTKFELSGEKVAPGIAAEILDKKKGKS